MHNSKIRILHVIGKMDVGGAETLIMNLYRNIDLNKFEFDFVVHTDRTSDFDEEINYYGGNIYKLPKFNGLNLLSYSIKFKRVLQNKKYDIVHGHIASSATIYLSIARLSNVLTISHSHSEGKKSGIRSYLWRVANFPTKFISEIYFSCSQAAGISRFGKNFNVNNNNSFIINNSVDKSKFEYKEENRRMIREKYGIRDEIIIGHIGRFSYPKNHKFMIEILTELVKINSNIKMIFVGDGETKKDIEDMVMERHLGEFVIFAGKQTDTSMYYSAMDIFVFPSIYEGLPTSIIEAQYNGLPILMSSNVTKESIISRRVIKLSIDDGVGDWCQLIQNLLTSKSQRIIDDIINDEFDILSTVEDVEQIYSTILGRRWC